MPFTPWPIEEVKRYQAQGLWTELTLPQLIDDAKWPNNTALIDKLGQWTYQTLKKQSDLLALALVQQGLEPGDTVVMQLPNCRQFFELLFALFKLGVKPIMALPTHRWNEIEHFCQFANAKMYLSADYHANSPFLDIKNKLLAKGSIQQAFYIDLALQDCLNASFDAIQEKKIDLTLSASHVGLYQLSGGTTGTSKLIPRTHYDYLYSVKQSVQICGFTQQTIYLAALPVGHNFTLSSPGALGVLMAGGTLVLSTSGAPDVTFPMIEKHKVTVAALVPPLAIAWLTAFENRRNSQQAVDLSSLQLLQVGGAKLSEAVAKKIQPVLSCQLQQVFGMAEGLVNYTRLDDDMDTIIRTQGRPMSEMDELKVVDDEDNELAVGETGHLLTRGPYTIRGYYRAQEHNQRAFTQDGFYRTGDIVKLDKQGNITVEGRGKDQINKGGEKIAAEELENYLLTHPGVKDAAVVAMQDDLLGERVCAYVIPNLTEQASRLKVSQLMKFLRTYELADFKYPDRIEFIETFPKTRLGKVDKKALRALIDKKLSALKANY